MEKVKNTKLAYYVDKLAVESEPGLTNAQLMLNNRKYHRYHVTPIGNCSNKLGHLRTLISIDVFYRSFPAFFVAGFHCIVTLR